MAAPDTPSLGHVVVIGGNGFLGHHIVAQALDSSRWSVSGVSSLDMRVDRNRSPDSRAAYHACDITDAAALSELLERLQPDVVIHTASPVASGQDGPVARDLYRRVNIDGTRAVVDACCQARVKALVYTSSASVISDNRSDLRNADERWPLVRGAQQHEYYSETKAAAEQLVLDANRSPHAAAPEMSSPGSSRNLLLTTALRPAGIFGEGDVQTLAGFLNALRTRRTNVQLGDNTNMFDFTYVGNVAHAHLLAANALITTAAAHTQPLDHEKVDGQVFFITNDSPCYFWDFARAVWQAAASANSTESPSPYPPPVPPCRVWVLSPSLSRSLGFLSELVCNLLGKSPTFTRQRAAMSTMTRYYNITKAKTLLGYQPLWTLPQGVARGVAWFLNQQNQPLVKS
ncbi:hypothetical protein CDD81_1844 [Ophiocordyceps australis]|uniref:3-beta hydroxysteroid dehydrogenase/isomerase domain-containing protein n=1 Tax=Ophiocordyceps australis TaxID=1399860 RepID=A0A2C5XF44_9HYPO|nr:hypothetical protein CDD81_1844 [Ophiocordyceps australis]